MKKKNQIYTIHPKTIDVSIVEELSIEQAKKVLDFIIKLKGGKNNVKYT